MEARTNNNTALAGSRQSEAGEAKERRSQVETEGGQAEQNEDRIREPDMPVVWGTVFGTQIEPGGRDSAARRVVFGVQV